MSKYLAIFAILLFCKLAAAQFGGFFEQMFQGEHRQQRQRPPGADHWRAQADASEFLPARTGDTTYTFFVTSSLFYVPLPRYPRVCGCSHTVPLSERGGHQVCDPRRPRQSCWYGDLREGWRVRRCRRLHERMVIIPLSVNVVCCIGRTPHPHFAATYSHLTFYTLVQDALPLSVSSL